MPYRLLPDVALADIAFEAEGATVTGLFESCGRAMTDIMVDRSTLRKRVAKTLRIAADNDDMLLYDFLTELIVLKDVDSLLFREFKVHPPQKGVMTAEVAGEPIDRVRHRLRNDVKAVTMHMFGVRHEGGRWKATVVLDI